jgi:hypothetical protein
MRFFIMKTNPWISNHLYIYIYIYGDVDVKILFGGIVISAIFLIIEKKLCN